jgi:hypothetical protein
VITKITVTVGTKTTIELGISAPRNGEKARLG